MPRVNAWIEPSGPVQPRVLMLALDDRGAVIESALCMHEPDEWGQIEVPDRWDCENGRIFRFLRAVPYGVAHYREQPVQPA